MKRTSDCVSKARNDTSELIRLGKQSLTGRLIDVPKIHRQIELRANFR
jgi:hypothetical protein